MLSNKWIIPQNSCDINQLHTTIKTFKEYNGITKERDVLQKLMVAQSMNGQYNPRSQTVGYDVSSANHKIDEAEFYGAIYETPNGKIHVSSYGELLLKYWNDTDKRNKIFIGMAHNVQFPHPNKPGLEGFEIYPIRLIFKLLLDEQLDFYLTNIEIAHLLYDQGKVEDADKYQKIVDAIIKFRNKDQEATKLSLEMDAIIFVKNYVSCNYLCNIFSELGIFSQAEKPDERMKIKSPLRRQPTTVTPKTVKISHNYTDFSIKINSALSVFDKVKLCDGQLKSDWIQQVYDDIPKIVLDEIGENDDMFTEYLQIPHLLIESSNDGTKWDLFEKYIAKAYNLFSDVQAERLGQPGEPDALCKFLKNNTIFVADGKATNTKLGSINDGRLRQHREKYGADYTIIVTPRFTPGAAQDIKGTNVCIITSYCFAELITNYIFKFYESKKECSYEKLDKLVRTNLGTDLSEKIYRMIDDELGVSKAAIMQEVASI